MKKWTTFLFLISTAYNYGMSQDAARTDSLFVIDIPDRLVLPANITYFNTGISLVPDNSWMFDLNDYPAYNPRRNNSFDLRVWQQDYIRDNKLRGFQRDVTLPDGNIMAWALLDKSPVNQEFYLNNVLMNQRAVGNTQLQRMNVRMKGPRYIDFIGLGQLGIISIIDMALPDDLPAGFRLGNQKRK